MRKPDYYNKVKGGRLIRWKSEDWDPAVLKKRGPSVLVGRKRVHALFWFSNDGLKGHPFWLLERIPRDFCRWDSHNGWTHFNRHEHWRKNLPKYVRAVIDAARSD